MASLAADMAGTAFCQFTTHILTEPFARWQRGAQYERERGGAGVMWLDISGAETLHACLARPMRFIKLGAELRAACAASHNLLASVYTARRAREGAQLSVVWASATLTGVATHDRCVQAPCAIPAPFVAWASRLPDETGRARATNDTRTTTVANYMWLYYVNGLRNVVVTYALATHPTWAFIDMNDPSAALGIAIDVLGGDPERYASTPHKDATLVAKLRAIARGRSRHDVVTLVSLPTCVLAAAARERWHIARGVLPPDVNPDVGALESVLTLWAPYCGAGSVGCWAEGCAADAELSPDLDLQRCSGCMMAMYCSRACQLRDWRAHKPECKTRVRRANMK